MGEASVVGVGRARTVVVVVDAGVSGVVVTGEGLGVDLSVGLGFGAVPGGTDSSPATTTLTGDTEVTVVDGCSSEAKAVTLRLGESVTEPPTSWIDVLASTTARTVVAIQAPIKPSLRTVAACGTCAEGGRNHRLSMR